MSNPPNGASSAWSEAQRQPNSSIPLSTPRPRRPERRLSARLPRVLVGRDPITVGDHQFVDLWIELTHSQIAGLAGI
jgi:hypothetical protein